MIRYIRLCFVINANQELNRYYYSLTCPALQAVAFFDIVFQQVDDRAVMKF
jgi:hypothetical protein